MFASIYYMHDPMYYFIFVKTLGRLQCLEGAVLKTAPTLTQNATLEYPQTTLRLVNLLDSLAESCYIHSYGLLCEKDTD